MKILIYSTNSGLEGYAYGAIHTYFPKRFSEWKVILDEYEEDEIYVCNCLAGNQSQLVDWNMQADAYNADNGRFHFVLLNPADSPQETAEKLAACKPDVAIAWSLPNVVYDWNPVKDALVAEFLREKSVKTICHSVDFTMRCFEKQKTSELLASKGYAAPRFVYVKNRLYNDEYTDSIFLNNVYREYIACEISRLRFPVVIKSAIGAGSMGLVVGHSFDKVIELIKSEKNTTDLIIEEKIPGESFGIEVYGNDGRYSVLPLVKFTTTEDGITDPFKSVKYGPVLAGKYNVDKLREDLKWLAGECDWQGGVELDLVFSDGIWYIVDINPRFSLLSHVDCLCINKNDILNIVDIAKGNIKEDYSADELNYVIDFKSTVSDDSILEAVQAEFPDIRRILKFSLGKGNNEVTHFSELAICSGNGFDDIFSKIKLIRDAYPDIVSDNVYSRIKEITEEMEK